VALTWLALASLLFAGCTPSQVLTGRSTTSQSASGASVSLPKAPKVQLTAEDASYLVLEAWQVLRDGYVDPPDAVALLRTAWDGFVGALPAGQTRPAFPEPRGVNPDADLLRFRTAYLTAATQVTGGGEAQAQLAYGAIRKMVESVNDCLTTFTDGNQMKEQSALAESDVRIGGVGIRIKKRPTAATGESTAEPIVVWELLEGGAAGKAGIKPGDAIVKVDGKEIGQMTLEQIAATIRGPEGTQVKLTVEHVNAKKTQDFTLKRAPIVEPALQTRMLKGDIAYFRLLGFGPTVQYDAMEALKGYEAKRPKGWIFDLRTNASGDYVAMQAMLGKLLKDGPFGYDQDQTGRRTALGPIGGYLQKQNPYAVLVSDSTSSAAELFAAAIDYHKGGTVIGTKTAGCSGVSTRVPLSDGSVLSVTVRRMLAPGGVELTRTGLTPKEVVEVSRTDLAAGKDPQLDRALAVLGAR